jgi:hypothetical protein
MIPNSNLVVVGKKTKEGTVVICSNIQKPEKILKTYRKRWGIERCFKNMKTQGFNLENTHMASLDRLLKLMVVVSVAILMASLLGLQQKCPFQKTVKTPLYSYSTRGLRWLKNNLITPDIVLYIPKLTQISASEG